ncbi:MAG: hypothetical protein AB1564_14160 [Chloroflexota bacterium]
MATPTPEPTPQPQLTSEQLAAQRESQRQQRQIIIVGVILLVLVIAGFVAAVVFLMHPETPAEQVGRIRDIFLIFMALESLLIGAALIVLIVQVASLINLMQNEVRPILNATSETVNTLRGTAEFLGENVVQPVIKLNSYLAGLQRVLELMGLKRK